jgi:acyl transferase domain-containing protein
MEGQKPNDENVRKCRKCGYVDTPGPPTIHTRDWAEDDLCEDCDQKDQTPESPVKSRSDQVQETVDRNLAERAARQKTTEEVIAKRKQTAALEQAEQMAKTGPALARGLHKAAEVVEAKAAEAAEAVEAVEAAAAVTSYEQKTEAVQEVTPESSDEEKNAEADKIVKDLLNKSHTRELREIEMHNIMIDALKEVTGQTQATCDLLSDIAGSMKEIASSISDIIAKH